MATFADKIVKDFVFVGGTNYQNNFLAEDFADRMSSTYTSAILLAICAVHITRVYFFSSIDCLLPSSATPEAAYRAYSDNICWAIGTVPVLANESLPRTKEDWEELYNKRGIGFYQWIPIMLTIQAILFYIPRLIWQAQASGRLGIDISKLIRFLHAANSSDSLVNRAALIQQTSYQLYHLARVSWRPSRSDVATNVSLRSKLHDFPVWLCEIPFRGRIVVNYLFIKLLYLGNAIGQLYLINRFLGFDCMEHSMLLLGQLWYPDLRKQRQLLNNLHFPVLTSCEIPVRMTGERSVRLVAQCAMQINTFNEKMFAFLYLWALLVSAITAGSLLLWLLRTLLSPVCGCFPYFSSLTRFQSCILRSVKREARRGELFQNALKGKPLALSPNSRVFLPQNVDTILPSDFDESEDDILVRMAHPKKPKESSGNEKEESKFTYVKMNCLDKKPYWRGELEYPDKVCVNKKKNMSKRCFNLEHLPSKKAVLQFIRTYLHYDGLFLLYLIEENVGKILTNEIISELWEACIIEKNNDILMNYMLKQRVPGDLVFLPRKMKLMDTVKPEFGWC